MGKLIGQFSKYKSLINTSKLFNTLSHKGNANQHYTEIPSHPSQDGNHQGNSNKYWPGCRETGTLIHVGGNVN
jgi:hypothetical protein